MTKYVLLDDQLYYKTIDGVLLKCLNQEEAKVLMGEVHEGIIRRTGYFWPTILEDCFEYYKGCQDYQCFGNIQKSHASVMNPIIKPWPF